VRAVGIDAGLGAATIPDARLLLLTQEHNKFVLVRCRFVSSIRPLAGGVAGGAGFRGHSSPPRPRLYAAAVPLALAVVLGASTARATPLPLEATLELGSPGAPVAIQVATDQGDTRIRVRAGRHTAEAAIGGPTRDATVERVALGAGSVAVVRAEGATGERLAALIVVARGRPSIAWSGRLDMHGDPGERTASSLEIADRTGDGVDDVVVGQLREGVALCGQPPVLLYPRALDPARLELRPVVLRRLPAEGEEVALTASGTSPGPTGGPVVRALSPGGASSALGVEEDARALTPARALVDGDPATAWIEGRGGAGEGELAVARFGAQMPIRALAVRAPPSASGARAPRSIVVVGDRPPRLRVTLPEGATERMWIVPPAPLSWSCLAVMIAESGGASGVRVGLSELEVFTEIDFEGGIDALIAALVRDDGEDGDRATIFLGRLGEPAVTALDAAWDRLGARGRERGARIATEPARAGSESALALLSRAATDESQDVRRAALEALSHAGVPGGSRIAALAASLGDAGEDAAALLARRDEGFDVAPLLAAAAAEGGSERPHLRAAIARGVALARADGETVVDAWAADAPLAARASVALGLAADPRTPALAARLIEGAIEGATELADRFRLAAAASGLGVGVPAIDAWLAALAVEPEEWMLRAAAVEALRGRRLDVTRVALGDRYPRVRIAAINALAREEDHVASVIETARQDSWPMVRVAALDAIADRASAREVLRGALDDDAQMVRRRAIEHLTRHSDRESWPAVSRRLLDADEWPIVTEAALVYVEELCVPEGGPALHAVIARGARRGAWELHVQLAVRALRIALRLGGEIASEARTIAGRGDEALRAALDQATTAPPPACGAQ
jgi:hypothetical protein